MRFVDTTRFMVSSLSTLASNLYTDDLCNFRETARVFSTLDIPLVTRKGVFSYEYMDSWTKLKENQLPIKNKFYSTLKEEEISDDDYERSKNVWSHFNCNTLGES